MNVASGVLSELMSPKMDISKEHFEMFTNIKFIYFEKATLLLSYVVPVKSRVEILQNFVAFSEYRNFRSVIYNEINNL